VDYGVRLGLTGSLSAAAGYALGFDHPGWAAAAALLVSRPTPDLTRTRAFGRAGAVVTGAAVALSVTAATPPNAVVAVLTAAALIGAAATTGSRWYITGGFTTFVVLTLMDLQTPSQSQWWFLERVAATLIGVTFAWVMMIVLPARAGGTAHGADLG
jgi:uncharacterized membrane protein YccC